MEATSIPALFYRSHQPVPSARLRRASDDQLVERFRAGREEAFGVIHDRYRVRLLAYVRQMLSARSNEDAEDVLQEVFERAARTLRSERPPAGLRPWLYSVAHNRCIDELRRRPPSAPDLLAASRLPADDTTAVAERRAEVARLFGDLGGLPELQRSALLMRELQGLSHAEVAVALGASVPAVKSLLVRARVGLAAAEEARSVACAAIRDDLAATHDRRVKASALAARHLRECTTCRSYRAELRRSSRRLGALVPAPAFFPLALIGRLLGGAGVQAKAPLVASGLAGGSGATLAGAGKLFAVLGTATVVTTGAVLEREGALPLFAPPGPHRTAQPGTSVRPGSSVAAARLRTADPRRGTSSSTQAIAGGGNRGSTGGSVRPTRRVDSQGAVRQPAVPGPGAPPAEGIAAPSANAAVPTEATQHPLPSTAAATQVGAASLPAADPAAQADAGATAPASGTAGTGATAPSGSPGLISGVVPAVTAAPTKLGQAGAALLGGGSEPGSTSPSAGKPVAGTLAPVVANVSGVLP